MLRTTRAVAVKWLAASLLLAIAPLAHGTPCPVSVGEVSSQVHRPHVDLPLALRSELRQALDDMPMPQPRDPLILSASLLRMDTERNAQRTLTTCVVAASVRQAKSGNLLATLKGRVRVEEQGVPVASTERLAMRSAVRSAIKRLPQLVQ